MSIDEMEKICMGTGKPGLRAPRSKAGTLSAWAAFTLVVMAALTAGSATSASALAPAKGVADLVVVAAPAAKPSVSTSLLSSHAGDGKGTPGDVNVGILAMVGAMGLAIGAPVVCRNRLARRRLIHRFRVQLRTVDVDSLGRRQMMADDARSRRDGPATLR